MKNRIGLILVLAIFVFCMTECLEAGSIWAKRDKNMRDLYADNVAHRIGDVLTIKVTENSKVDNKAKRDLQKDTSKSNTFNGEIGGFADIGEFGLSAESSNNLKGKADYKDERSFVDSITVVVVDVLPNGNLVVLGTRSREIAGDTQTIEVSGIVQPIDIAFDNTIVSQRVANFRIFTKNAGVAEPYTRQGWLGRIFDIIWPF
jgi:flagellar L-ring protein precursor FlgH